MIPSRYQIILALIVAIACLPLIGCGGSSTYSPTTGGSGTGKLASYTIVVTSASQVLYTTNDPSASTLVKAKAATAKDQTPNTSASYSVTVTPVNGYKGTVQLSATMLQAYNLAYGPGFTTTFSPSSVTLDGVHVATTTFTVANPALKATQGTYQFQVSGSDQSGPVVSATEPILHVQLSPSFEINANVFANYVTGAQGDQSVFTVFVIPRNGFVGTVNLGSTNTDPSGLSGTFSAPSVTLDASGAAGIVTFTTKVTQSGGVSGGPYTYNLTGQASNSNNDAATSGAALYLNIRSF